MIRYQESTNVQITDYNTILDALGVEPITDEEVWEMAKQYEDIPNFDNILYGKTFEEMKVKLEEKYALLSLDIVYEVNERASYFNIDGKTIRNWRDCEEYLEMVKRELQVEYEESLAEEEQEEIKADYALEEKITEMTKRFDFETNRLKLHKDQKELLLLRLLNEVRNE